MRLSNISIHALLAESDHVGAGTIQTPSQISIHALLAESDANNLPWLRFEQIFLSTLSLRRATDANAVIFLYLENFYPRSPCGERRTTR